MAWLTGGLLRFWHTLKFVGEELRWLLTNKNIDFKTLMLMHHCFAGCTPSYQGGMSCFIHSWPYIPSVPSHSINSLPGSWCLPLSQIDANEMGLYISPSKQPTTILYLYLILGGFYLPTRLHRSSISPLLTLPGFTSEVYLRRLHYHTSLFSLATPPAAKLCSKIEWAPYRKRPTWCFLLCPPASRCFTYFNLPSSQPAHTHTIPLWSS